MINIPDRKSIRQNGIKVGVGDDDYVIGGVSTKPVLSSSGT